MPGALGVGIGDLNSGGRRRSSGGSGLPSLQTFMGGSGGGGFGAQPLSGFGAQPVGGAPQGLTPPTPATPPPLTNTAQNNPNLDQAWAQYQARLAALQAREGQADPNLQTQVDRLNQRMSSDTSALQKNKALTDLAAQGSAMKEQALARASMSGQATGGAMSDIEAAIQRQQAAAAQGIDIGQQNRLDALTLGGQGIMAAPGQDAFARQRALNAFLGQGAGQAGQMAGNLLAQHGIGLNQWQAQQNVGLQQQQLAQGGRQNAISNWMRMLQLAGYGG